jgi:hypothetical protein
MHSFLIFRAEHDRSMADTEKTHLLASPVVALNATEPARHPGRGMAVAAMVCSIIGVFCFPFILPIIGIALGASALASFRRGPRPDNATRGMAIAGVTIGSFALLAQIAVIVVLVNVVWFPPHPGPPAPPACPTSCGAVADAFCAARHSSVSSCHSDTTFGVTTTTCNDGCLVIGYDSGACTPVCVQTIALVMTKAYFPTPGTAKTRPKLTTSKLRLA